MLVWLCILRLRYLSGPSSILTHGYTMLFMKKICLVGGQFEHITLQRWSLFASIREMLWEMKNSFWDLSVVVNLADSQLTRLFFNTFINQTISFCSAGADYWNKIIHFVPNHNLWRGIIRNVALKGNLIELQHQ